MKGGDIGHFPWKIGITSSQIYIITGSGIHQKNPERVQGSLLIKVMNVLVV